MEQISSENNQRVRRLVSLGTQAKARRQDQSFVIEGKRIVEDAPDEFIRELYVSESFLGGPAGAEAQGPVADKIRRHDTFVLSDRLFRKVADTETPQGILALVRQPVWQMEDLLHRKGPEPGKSGPLLLVLEDIQDPGNLGTMFRTAEAAGADGVILSRGTVDLFNPKTVRSTMSAIFRMPFVRAENLAGLPEELHRHGITSYAADLRGSVPYDTCSYCSGTAFFIGNEGNGLRPATAAAADHRIRIPMEGKIESLNAAMSAGILLYEAHRQRQRRLCR